VVVASALFLLLLPTPHASSLLGRRRPKHGLVILFLI
jgi:hypothetical protein